MSKVLLYLIHTDCGLKCSLAGNGDFTEICSGFEAGSCVRLIDFVFNSTLGLRVIKKQRDGLGPKGLSSRWRVYDLGSGVEGSGFRVKGKGSTRHKSTEQGIACEG